jgi:homoserine O-acetyltransferase
LLAALVVIAPTLPAAAQAPPSPPQVASLGTCTLASGAKVPDCRVAYRTFGRSNSQRSNTVLFPTWLFGRSEDLMIFFGPNAIADTTRFYVVLVDALGNGNSSSPSNTPGGRAAFDGLTVGDMVESQHRLLTEKLGLRHVHAIMGISMGGMQSLEWGVRYPAFSDILVPMMGSPRVPAHDRLMWATILDAIRDGQRSQMPKDSLMFRVARLGALFLRTPAGLNERGVARVTQDVAEDAQASMGWDPDDYAAQLQAIRRHDISLRFGGDIERAAKEIRARTLIVFSPDDHMVTPGPVVEFARLIGAETLSVPSNCGHVTFGCEEGRRIGPVVREFLTR